MSSATLIDFAAMSMAGGSTLTKAELDHICESHPIMKEAPIESLRSSKKDSLMSPITHEETKEKIMKPLLHLPASVKNYCCICLQKFHVGETHMDHLQSTHHHKTLLAQPLRFAAHPLKFDEYHKSLRENELREDDSLTNIAPGLDER